MAQSKLFATILKETNPTISDEAAKLLTFQDFEAPPIPENFDGRITWKNYLSPIYNQHNCASCYSYATNGCLADKFALQTLAQVKPLFNPLETIMCMTEATSADEYIHIQQNLTALQQAELKQREQGCKGNTLYSVGAYLYRWGAMENNCISLKLLEDDLIKTGSLPICTVLEGTSQDRCLDQNVPQRVWPISSYYTLSGSGDALVRALQLDVMKWGPLTVAFNVYNDFVNEYDGKSIYIPKAGQSSLGGHAVKLIGWGQQNQIPYWICANSWGTDWGENGYFKIVRLNNLLNLEDNHIGIQPQLPGVVAQIPFSPLINRITPEEVKERAFNNIDPLTFYPKKYLSLIKDGKLKGELKPVIDMDKLPMEFDFYACYIDTDTFISTKGNIITSPYYNGPNKVCHSYLLWFIITCILLFFSFLFMLYLRRRYKMNIG